MCYNGNTNFSWAQPGIGSPPPCKEGVIFLRSLTLGVYTLGYIFTGGGGGGAQTRIWVADPGAAPGGVNPSLLATQFWPSQPDWEYRIFPGLYASGAEDPAGPVGSPF